MSERVPQGGLAIPDDPSLFLNGNGQFSAPLVGGGVNVMASQFGVAGDDPGDGTGTDDTAALQAAANAAVAAGRPLFWESGRNYRINGLVKIQANQFRWIQPRDAIIIDNNPSGPCIQFGNDAAQLSYLTIDGLQVKKALHKYRQPSVQLGTANGLSFLFGRGIRLDGNNKDGDGILAHTIYDGTISDVEAPGHGGGIPFVWHNASAINTGNISFRDWTAVSAPVMFAIKEFHVGSGNTINSLHFDNCKHVANAGNKFFAGTTGGTQSATDTTVTLTGGQGSNYAAGDWVVFVTGLTYWIDRVASVAGDVLTLTATGGLPFAMSAGDPVIVGHWHSVLGATVKAAKYTVPHFEQSNGVLGIAASGVRIEEPYLGVNLLRGAYLVKSCSRWRLESAQGTLGASAVLLHQANDANNSRNSIRDVAPADLGGLGTVLQVDGGSAITWNDRYGGSDTLLGAWTQITTVAASQAAVKLTGPNGSNARSMRMKHYGQITGLAVAMNAARTNGVLTVAVFKNGSQLGTLAAVIDGTNTTWVTSDAIATLNFAPGDQIDCRITTDASWAPASNSLDVYLYGAI